MRETRRRVPESATATARRLRRESTPPERVLWGLLRGRRLDGLKFRRQVPVAGYVVDFLCREASLVVELDGVSHIGTGAADDRRTEALNRHGLRVVRVTNHDVAADPDAVASYILAEARRAAARPSPQPSP
ncbi:MAG: endonuclease domain-containing protein [Phycisphaeraceae bacterium]